MTSLKKYPSVKVAGSLGSAQMHFELDMSESVQSILGSGSEVQGRR